MKYRPEQFANTYAEENGSEIWEFLNEPESVIRMETATYLSRPALEPVSPTLVERIGEKVAHDRTKQMVGHMVRQIMEARGYRLDRSGVRIKRKGNIFTSATRYA